MARRKSLDAVAGLLAAAVALGVGEFVASAMGLSSLVIAVGNAIVDYTPGPLVKTAIEALGTNDKPFLLLTVTVASLAIGAAIGPLAARHQYAGVAALGGFAVVGAFAIQRNPLGSLFATVLVPGAAAVAGFVALRVLLRAATPATEETVERQRPGRGIAGRRKFLTFAVGAAGAAAASVGASRVIGASVVDVEAERNTLVLPPAPGPAISTAVGVELPGLSLLITPNDRFYRIDTALTVPRVDIRAWRLRVKGMVDHPYELTLTELLALPTTEQVVTLACVSNEIGGRLVGDAVWRGTPLAGILARAGVQPGATQIVGRSVDGFTVGFPTSVALDGRASMVAFGMNGEPLPAQHGFPARLVIPGLYGYVSATKWLTEIELTTLDAFDAYWIPRGWDKLGPILTESRIDVPRDGATVPAGHVAIAGVAWAGNRAVSRVEVSIHPSGANDSAQTWMPARLSEALSDSTWRQWVADWDATPGNYDVAVRAADGHGDLQTAVEQAPGPNGATGYHRIYVQVR